MYKAEQLALILRQLIEQGKWKAHEKLPSLREQVQISGYSLMTVLNAYQELEAQGLIYSKEKSGFFVEEQIDSTLINNHHAKTTLNTHIEINSLVFNYLKSTQQSDIVAFGSAFPNEELLCNKKLIQIMAQQARYKRSYHSQNSMPPGNPLLQNIIARRYCLQGLPTDSNDIVITSGCLDALNLSLQAIAQNGDYILLQQTIFYGAWQAAERLGLKVITLPEHPTLGFDLEKFEQCLRDYPIKVCWLMVNSHNPIGFTINDDIKAKIAQLLEKYQVYLIEDDVYQELYYSSKRPLPIKHFDQGNFVLHCSSFSKTLGAGFRVGWVHAGLLAQKIQHLQLMSTISVSPLSQYALCEFLSTHHYEKHLRRLRLTLESYKKIIYNYLKEHLPTNFKIYYFPSGYFLWIELPTNLNSMRVYQQLLNKKISIAPSVLFTINPQQKNYFRLNCSLEWNKTTQHALDMIINTLQNYDI